jgi:hypothetical protein
MLLFQGNIRSHIDQYLISLLENYARNIHILNSIQNDVSLPTLSDLITVDLKPE